jgi:ArsR family transcriptional regulator
MRAGNSVSPEIMRSARGFRALAHPHRLAVLRFLADGPRSAGEIEEMVGSTQSNVSQHLAVLKKAGLVAARKEGSQVYYHAESWRVFKFLATADDLFAGA